MNELENYNEKIFENIKHIDEFGNEYWLARELMPILEYSLWQRFSNVLRKAMENCLNSNHKVSNHFIGTDKMINIAKNAVRNIQDYKLTRYACYLIVQNANPKKKAVALGQTFYAVQTWKIELTEEGYSKLSEDEKRLYQRNLTKKGKNALNETAKKAGVKNFDKFHNA